MQRFEERTLAFEFGEQWQVLKLDEQRHYLQKLHKLDGSKAVDFLGIWADKDLYFIEVKDLRQYRIQNKDRLVRGDLAIEIAQKVRDSIACIVSAYQTSSEPNRWQPYMELLLNRKRSINIIIWLELNLPSHPAAQVYLLNTLKAKSFQTKLSWLTKRVYICKHGDQQYLPDVTVSNLPHHQQASSIST